jgi:hypothetical protein
VFESKPHRIERVTPSHRPRLQARPPWAYLNPGKEGDETSRLSPTAAWWGVCRRWLNDELNRADSRDISTRSPRRDVRRPLLAPVVGRGCLGTLGRLDDLGKWHGPEPRQD